MIAWFTLEHVLITLYLGILLTLALYGFHRSHAGLPLLPQPPASDPVPKQLFADLPMVTVQLPLFNEMYVASRLLDAVAQIALSAHFEIQVLDDSTDETQEICRAKVEELQAAGIDIQYLHRVDRTGFKAGALAEGPARRPAASS